MAMLRFLPAPCLCLLVSTLYGHTRIAATEDLQFPDFTIGTGLSYQTDARVTLQEEKNTFYVKQYHNIAENLGRLDELRDGTWYSYFYNSDRKALVMEYTCQVEAIKETGSIEEILHWNYVKDKVVVIGPTAVLMRGLDYRKDMTYKNTSTVRGILCNVWTMMDQTMPGLRMDFYFEVTDWENPFSGSGLPSTVPVRVEMHGNVRGQGKHIEIDYYSFQPYIDNLELLSIPPGRGCQGIPIGSVPSVSFQYSFYAETVDQIDEQQASIINVFGVFIDGVHDVVRLDGTTDRIRYSIIQDFKTGAQYHLRADVCYVEPISAFVFEQHRNINITAPDPLVLLRLDLDFYPLGSATVRNIKCNVWESVVKNVNLGSVRFDKVVTTYYFTEVWTVEVTRGRKSERVPARVLVTAYKDTERKPSFRRTVNFYWFVEGNSQEFYQNFDISKCYTRQDQRIYFQMIFLVDAHNSGIASSNDNQFRRVGGTTAAVYASVSPSRLSFLQVDYEANRILVIGRLLERPPYGINFVVQAELSDPGDNEVDAGKAADSEMCAYRCLSHKDWPCRGFHYCSGQCFIAKSSEQKDWGHPISSYRQCSFHIRTDMDSDLEDLQSTDAIKILENFGNLSFIVQAENGDQAKYSPTSFRLVDSPFEFEQDNLFELTWKSYQLKEAQTTISVMESVESVAECYRACLTETTLFCSSFSFCTESRTCRLGSITVDSSPKSRDDNLVPNPKCDLYVVDYLNMFDKLPGEVVVSGDDSKFVDASTPRTCAEVCRKEKCRGFEFCDQLKSCNLHQRHRLELKPNQLANTTYGCSHYSLKYIGDYMMLGNQVLKDPKKQELRGKSVEDCARLCSENTEFDCQAFNYCPSNTDDATPSKCTLYMQRLQADNHDTSTTNCALYQRREGLNGNTSRFSTVANGITSSRLAGIIVGMLILGFVVGIAVFFGVAHFRKRRPNSDMTITFVKDEVIM